MKILLTLISPLIALTNITRQFWHQPARTLRIGKLDIVNYLIKPKIKFLIYKVDDWNFKKGTTITNIKLKCDNEEFQILNENKTLVGNEEFIEIESILPFGVLHYFNNKGITFKLIITTINNEDIYLSDIKVGELISREVNYTKKRFDEINKQVDQLQSANISKVVISKFPLWEIGLNEVDDHEDVLTEQPKYTQDENGNWIDDDGNSPIYIDKN